MCVCVCVCVCVRARARVCVCVGGGGGLVGGRPWGGNNVKRILLERRSVDVQSAYVSG